MIAGKFRLVSPLFRRAIIPRLNTTPIFSEKAFRRQGLALEALRLMLQYATSPLRSSSPSPLPVKPESLVVRIGAHNAPSIALFERLGFTISKRVEVFDEVEMKFAYDPASGSLRDIPELVRNWDEAKVEEIDFE